MLAGEARDTGSVVILADADGMILDTIGDTGFLSRAAQVALRPGVSWTEASTGTNAIGTAIAERRPITVHGPEHFFAEHAVLSCAATRSSTRAGRSSARSTFRDHRPAAMAMRWG